MSLVPPKELEELLGSQTRRGNNGISDEIGRPVSEGYDTWKKFDKVYRKSAEQIRSTNPGSATWADLGWFLLKFGGAKTASDTNLISFEFKDDEIVAVDENLPSIVLNEKLCACGDTSGMVLEQQDGRAVQQLGMNLPEVVDRIRDAFLPERPCGAAHVRMKLEDDRASRSPSALLFFLRQTIRQELGRAHEEKLSLHAYRLIEGNAPVQLTAAERSGFIRELGSAVRIKEPQPSPFTDSLATSETDIAGSLRKKYNRKFAMSSGRSE